MKYIIVFFVCLFVACAAATFAINSIWQFAQESRSDGWTEATGIVTGLADTTEHRGFYGYVPLTGPNTFIVSYDYGFNSTTYRGDRFFNSYRPTRELRWPSSNFTQKYKAGAAVKVYVNPGAPQEACLYKGTLVSVRAVGALAMQLVVAGVFGLAAFLSGRRFADERRRSPCNPSI